MRVRQFELRLIGIALVIAWAVAAVLVLVAYRPGGPLDLLVGVTTLLPILIASTGVIWPPVARGAGAFPLMVSLGLGSLLFLLPSIGGVFNQLQALGSQTLLPSPEAAYPWLLALLGTSLFSGFGLARHVLGGSALRPRRLAVGIAFGVGLTLLAGIMFTGVAIANEVALRDQPGAKAGSRFGPTDLDGSPPSCDGVLSIGPTARMEAHLTSAFDLRRRGSVDQSGVRNTDGFRWTAYVATDRELGWYGVATTDGHAWVRLPGGEWESTTPTGITDGPMDLIAIDAALTEGIRATAEDRGTEVVEGAPARRCRVSIDGTAFRAAFPQVRWLVGPADLADWRGQLDFWVFLDGEIGQIAGSLSGEGAAVSPEALQGTIEVLLTATARGRDHVVYPPVR